MTEVRDSHLKGGLDERKDKLREHLKIRRIGHLKGEKDEWWTDEEDGKVELGKRKIYRRKIFWPWPSTFRLKELFFSTFFNRASTLIIIDFIYNINVGRIIIRK